MYILALETTGPLGSVAIIDDKGNVAQKTSGQEMNHLKELMLMAQQLIYELGIEKKELTAVAASIGPGSFTGIRIGVSSARAIAQALNLPAVGVRTLDAFKEKCNGSCVIVPIFNARRGQVYGGVFDEEGGDILKSGPYMLEDVLEAIKVELADRFQSTSCGMPLTSKVVFYGDGVDAYEERLDDFTEQLRQEKVAVIVEKAPKEVRYQDGEMIARVALKQFCKGETLSVEQLLPDYMRATEAEQKLKDGSLQRERAAKLARFKAR